MIEALSYVVISIIALYALVIVVGTACVVRSWITDD